MKAVVMKEVGDTDVMEFVDWPEPVARRDMSWWRSPRPA